VNFRFRSAFVLIVASTCAAPLATAKNPPAGLKPGDKMYAIANLHPDMQRHLLYTLNYQLPGIIPVCSELTVTEIHSKKLAFTYNGQEFEIEYDSFTKEAGVSFPDAVKGIFFGTSCDKAKMQSLGKVDQDGIRAGAPRVGMTREGILFAMGRPPFHANPDLNSDTWMYWRNRFGKLAVEFGADGKVSNIR
jgi:hypothetical protein